LPNLREEIAAMEFDPYDRELHQDPYPVYRRLRDDFPVHHNPRLRFWTLSRHADVLAALQAPDLFISGKGVYVGVPDYDDGKLTAEVPLLITTDRPRHTQLRALVSRAFTPRRIALLEPRIRAIARGLLDNVKGRREFDLVREFSGPLPTIVIAELLGVPAEDQEWFKEKSTAVAQFDPTARRDAAAAGPAIELGRYLAEVLAERRREPRDDLLSALLAAEIDGQRLSDVELIGFGFLLLVAGNETTTNLISNAAILLDRHRDQRRLLLEDPGRISGAIEEFLRYDSPVQGLARTTTAPVTLHAVTIPEASKVLLLFGSANHDERAFPEAERFDVLRAPNPHVAFGFGAHFCLGANLARLEARVAFEELLARLPDYRMTQNRVERHCSGPIRGALSLPIAES
jgi:cytochrome P450